jgi:hypothetical protein
MARALPKFDIVGPTVDADMRRLILRYGEEAARQALKTQTARKRGRPHEKDWQFLAPILRVDARNWLEGGDPFSTRSNASIAREIAEKHRGQSLESDLKRITRKLSQSRRYLTFCEAEIIARKEFPCATYLRVLDALLDTGKHRNLWETEQHNALGAIADFTAKFGKPDPQMSLHDMESETAKPVKAVPMTERRNVLQLLIEAPRR